MWFAFNVCPKSSLPRGIFVDPLQMFADSRLVCAQQRQVCQCQSYGFASFAFARVLVAVMCLLQFFGRLCYCWYCAHTSIVGTRRRLRTSPEGVAPATSGVLVQVCIVRCIVLRSYTVSSAVQLLYSRGIFVRAPRDPTDSEWKRSAAQQRQVIDC